MIDCLENRRLLAGVTLLAHGINGNINGWIAAASQAIVQRAGGADAAAVYTMRIERSGGDIRVASLTKDPGSKGLAETTSGEMIVRISWAEVAGANVNVKSVGEALARFLLQPQGDLPALATLPLHLVGHSRGAALMAQTARFLGKRGVAVDHLTLLDPVPVAGLPNWLNDQFGDGAVAAYDNVVFAETYWRRGGEALNGAHIAGTYNGDLNQSVGQHHLFSAHAAVPAYWVGTIDPTATTAGDHPIYPQWYGTTSDKPARDQ
ncbi:MAG: hypothetical protein NZ561_09140, partial [Phycisphaerae bacterium]|nr:hypothetical protein [Phycisphaerae bacterium]